MTKEKEGLKMGFVVLLENSEDYPGKNWSFVCASKMCSNGNQRKIEECGPDHDEISGKIQKLLLLCPVVYFLAKSYPTGHSRTMLVNSIVEFYPVEFIGMSYF